MVGPLIEEPAPGRIVPSLVTVPDPDNAPSRYSTPEFVTGSPEVTCSVAPSGIVSRPALLNDPAVDPPVPTPTALALLSPPLAVTTPAEPIAAMPPTPW